MDNGGCLYTTIKAFSELDLHPDRYDSIKMGYIFENLVGRFFQNVDAGQYYTGRDIIKLLVQILVSEGSDDILHEGKVVTIIDQACGTGGMLSTAFSCIKQLNKKADINLFGQEFMPNTYAIGLAEMLIKGQNADNFRNEDTLKTDCFPNQKMRFVIENPPFGTAWSGKEAKKGQEEAVKSEYQKGQLGEHSRWGHGLPAGGDSQLLFMQSAIDKMDEQNGRAAIIQNGSPFFTGGTASGESQIRRWMLEADLIEAIIALPTDLFYNTSLQTYVWVLSKNKRKERKGKVQLIDASGFFHKLRKAMGDKRNELTSEDREKITKLYTDFKESEQVKIFDCEDFLYREYSVYQPMQRSYAITEKRIEAMIAKGALSNIYNIAKVEEYLNPTPDNPLDEKAKAKALEYIANKDFYDSILERLRENLSEKVYLKAADFLPVINEVLKGFDKKKVIEKVMTGLSEIDKNAEIQRDRKGDVIWDKETKDIEIIPFKEEIGDYMKREVLPHVPDGMAFFEEDLTAKKPVIKIGAEIPFTRYFYKYQEPAKSEDLAKKFGELEAEVQATLATLFQ